MSYNKIPFTSIVAYLRKSRADGEDSVEEVLAKHERILQDYCLRTYGAELPEHKILREVQSGETIESRPVMRQLVSLIQSGEIGGVLVVDLQRLSRGDLIDIGTLSRLFQVTGCEIITPTRQYNLTDEYDRSFFEMEIMHGKDYLAYIKKIMSRGREQSVRDGNYIGSVAPYGYDKIFVNKKPTLSINETEAAVVRMIFDWYSGDELLGPVRIADRLNEMGIKPRKAEHWTQAAVTNVIESPIYCGKVYWNARKTQKKFVDGKLVETRPRNDDVIIIQGKHDPIISEEQFEAAQKAKRGRAHANVHKSQTLVNPLAGLLRCECGGVMTFKKYYSKKSHEPLEPMLVCSDQRNCGGRASFITPVLAAIKSSIEDALPKYAKLAKKAEKGLAKSPALDVLKKELEECETKQEKLYDYLERGIYSETVFIERTKKLTARRNELSAAIEKAQSTRITAEQYREFMSALRELADSIEDQALPADMKNKMLRRTVREIIYHRERSPRRAHDPTPVDVKVYFVI